MDGLGDSGYLLNSNLITSILSPVTYSERIYNRALLKTDRIHVWHMEESGNQSMQLEEAYAIALK